MKVVIGGGIAGLTCAYRLKKKGHEVLLFEPDTIGGALKSSQLDGFTLERGPNVLVARDNLMQLLGELDLLDDVTYPSKEPFDQLIGFNDQAVRVPKKLWEIVKSPLFDWADLFCVLKGFFLKKPFRADDKTIAQIFESRFSKNIVDRVLEPVLKGIYGGSPYKLSARSVFPNLFSQLQIGRSIFQFFLNRKKAGKRMMVLYGGNAVLANKLCSYLDGNIRNEKVVKLYREGNKFIIKSDKDTQIKADEVFIATAGKASAEFMEPFNKEIATKLKSIQWASLVVAHVAAPNEGNGVGEAFGILLPHSEEPLIGVMFNSNLFPHVSPDDQSLFTVMLGGAQHPEAIALNDNKLKEIAERAVVRYGKVKEPRTLLVTRWEQAIPQFELGHHKIVHSVRMLEQQHPGLHFIGVDMGGVGVSDRIRIVEELVQ